MEPTIYAVVVVAVVDWRVFTDFVAGTISVGSFLFNLKVPSLYESSSSISIRSFFFLSGVCSLDPILGDSMEDCELATENGFNYEEISQFLSDSFSDYPIWIKLLWITVTGDSKWLRCVPSGDIYPPRKWLSTEESI